MIGFSQPFNPLFLSKTPIRYTPALWSLTFPFEMYALASLRLSFASDVTAFRCVAFCMAWVALAV